MRIFLKHILSVLGIGFVLQAGIAGEVQSTVNIPPEKASGFISSPEGMKVVSRALDLTTPGTAVIFDAENADVKHDVETVSADGSVFVKKFNVLRYPLKLDKARKLKLYALLRAGNNNYQFRIYHHLFDAFRDWKTRGLKPEDEAKKLAGKWRWELVYGAEYKPSKPYLELNRPGIGVDEPEIDKLAFVPYEGNCTPEDTPKQENIWSKPGEYVIYSQSIQHAAAIKLISAKLIPEVRGGLLEASADKGKTWKKAADLLLQEKSLILRARFPSGVPDGTVVKAFQAEMGFDDKDFLEFKNKSSAIIFDLKKNGVFRMGRPDEGMTFASPEEAVPLFMIGLKKRGQPWPDADSKDPIGKILEAGKDSVLTHYKLGGAEERPEVVLEYSFLEGKIICRVIVKLLDNGVSEWKLELDNRSEWDILTYIFPRFAGMKAGTSAIDDYYANTNIYGPNPAKHRPPDREYPGWGALGWTSLFDESSGFSLQVRDVMEGKSNLRCLRGSESPEDACRLEAVKKHCVASGEKRAWTYVVYMHKGDWHAAADLYRQWWDSTFGKADHFPDWVRDSNGWIGASPAMSDNSFKWPRLLKYFKTGRRLGLNHLQVWGQFGSSPCGSFWWPSPKYGSIDEFAAVNKKIRESGGHVGYYFLYDRINRYNLIDTKTFDGYLPRGRYPATVPEMSQDDFKRDCMVTDPEGKVTAWPQDEKQMNEFKENLKKILSAGKKTVWAENTDGTFPGRSMGYMNPSSKNWQDWQILWIAGLYSGEWNCDTAYQDVLACGNKGRSFDLRRGDHGHVFPSGNLDITRRIIKEGIKAVPDFVLSAEGKMEIVTRWAMGLCSNLHSGWIYLDTHRYTHPDHVLFLGAQNGGSKELFRNCQLAFLYGAKFDIIYDNDLKTRELVTLRLPFIRFISRADYQDTVGVKFTGEGVEARRFERTYREGNSTVISIINPDEISDGTIKARVKKDSSKALGAFWFRSDGVIEKAEAKSCENEGWACFNIPPVHSAALLILTAPPKGEELAGRINYDRHPDCVKVKWEIANLEPLPRVINVKVRMPGTENEVNSKLKIPAFGIIRGNSSIPLIESEDDNYLILEADGNKLSEAYLYPLVENGSFNSADSLYRPETFAKENGNSYLRMGPAKGWQGQGVALNLEPDCRYKLSLKGRRTGGNGMIYALLRLKSDKWGYHNIQFPKDRFNEWLEMGTEFETPRGFRSADIYLYNRGSAETVDYDDVKVDLIDTCINKK